MLPPEARLESTDISYNKGCYIGQEIISRMKSSGKVNRRLTLFSFDALASIHNGPLIDTKGTACGELTSISPMIDNGVRYALGYVKRGVDDVFYKTDDGLAKPTVIVGSINGKSDQ
jgi:folate-binding Fe-S cluster repair protein YgfZ